MKNLLQFLLRYHLFLLFIVLEAFCFFVIFRSNNYQQAAYLNMANGINGKFYETYNGALDYLYLRRYSDSLVVENAYLRQQLMESKIDNKVDSGTVSQSIATTDSSKRFVLSYNYIPARVIKNSVNQAANFIYLNRGKLQGVERQMGVIAPDGIVGQVIDVSDNYCAVMSVLSKDFRVPAKFKKNDYFGNLRWLGTTTGTAMLEEIPKHVPAKVGDTIVTSGYSQIFPRNIMVGIVKEVESEADKPFLHVTVKLSTEFGKLNYVYVVKNMQRQEIQYLDSVTNQNKQ